MWWIVAQNWVAPKWNISYIAALWGCTTRSLGMNCLGTMNVCTKFQGNPLSRGQAITKISKIHHLGTMSFCTKFNDNSSKSSWDISVWIGQQTDTAVTKAMPLVGLKILKHLLKYCFYCMRPDIFQHLVRGVVIIFYCGHASSVLHIILFFWGAFVRQEMTHPWSLVLLP